MAAPSSIEPTPPPKETILTIQGIDSQSLKLELQQDLRDPVLGFDQSKPSEDVIKEVRDKEILLKSDLDLDKAEQVVRLVKESEKYKDLTVGSKLMDTDFEKQQQHNLYMTQEDV